MLLTLGPAFGVESLSFKIHYGARHVLRRIPEEDLRQFSDLSDLSYQQQGDFSVLMNAIRNNDLTCVRDLLTRNDSIVNIEDQYGHTPLVLALSKKHDSIAICLVEHGADVNQTTRCGANPLLSTESIDMAEYLLQHEANLDYMDEDEDTLLHLAVKNGKKYLIEWLIKKGLSVNQENKSKQTALFWAVQITDVHIVNSLIKNGARITDKILELAAKQLKSAKREFDKINHDDSTIRGKCLSEEITACMKIADILEDYSVVNESR